MSTQIALTPYLHFNGNCEEALNAYKAIFDGTIEDLQRYGVMNPSAKPDQKNKIIHAVLKFGGCTVLASDSFGDRATGNGTTNTALSLDYPDAQQAKQVFDQLAQGGQVGVPFEKQFWGAWHGNAVDRFGIYWMMNCPG
jgi:PhnB protein